MNRHGNRNVDTLRRLTAIFSNLLLTGMLGLLLGLFLCWSSMVRPLQVSLDKREEALQEWERINRSEREVVATMKTISTEEMRKWIATLDKHNNQFAEVQALLHKQEIALTGPGTTYLLIALIALIAVAGCVAWMIRDSNAEAARTLQNVIAILPALKKAAAGRNVTTVEGATAAALQGGRNPSLLSMDGRRQGQIIEYLVDRAYGYIQPNDGGDKVFFHKNEVRDAKSMRLRPSLQVTYLEGKDRQGRACAKAIQILS